MNSPPPKRMRFSLLLWPLLLLLGGAVWLIGSPAARHLGRAISAPVQRTLGIRPAPTTFAERLAYAAEDIVDPRIVYDPAYVSLDYPGGDVPPTRGVCADVIIRAYRRLDIDLQVRVHTDMKAHFSAYPQRWGLRRPDRNIDHRRVYNLATFFKRHGQTLPCTQQGDDYRPGDIVCWTVQNLGHIGLVSSRRNGDDTRYLIVHNIGGGQVLEDMLFAYPIIGHFRYAPPPPAPH
jgi:uncharacterized protein YijF (DUF1287 family)